MEKEEQRAKLGEYIFPNVKRIAHNPADAPKITGMLIDLDVFEVTEILEFIED